MTSRFGLLTTLDRGVPSLWSQLESAGAARRCAGIRAVGPSGDAIVDATPVGREQRVPESCRDDLARRLEEQGRDLVAAGADGLVLACAGFSPMSAALSVALDLPVCDGVALGACIAHGLWASGVWTSKTGAYAWSDAAWAEANRS